MPADPTPTATNEANRPTEEPARTVRRLAVGVLALIAFLVCAGLTAAFAAPAGAVGREASPRNDRHTEDNPQGPDREGLMRSASPRGTARRPGTDEWRRAPLCLPAAVMKESTRDFAFRAPSRR
jgi:hypothetical protein